ncbi:MAG TPA: diguanylate cyclase [Bdellovibrionota bacterium]|nr:diguanylate cyclase [Bdellovibrionota bacterium]
MGKNPFNVLVADDEESLRGIVTEVLTDGGYAVDSAINGKQALEMVKGEKQYHVVITDIRMPEMTGIELLEKIKEHDPTIQVVIMTSHGSLDTAIKAIRLGAYDYLTKPFEDLDVITTVINRTVEKLRLEREVKRLVDELKRRNEDVEALYDCTAQLATTLDGEEILSKATSFFTRLGRSPKAIYFLYDAEKEVLAGSKAFGWKEGKIEDLTFELKGAKSVANYFKTIDDDTELKKRMALTPVPERLLLLPLHSDEKIVGVFAVTKNEAWGADDRALLTQFAGNVSTQVGKAKLHDRVTALAVHDGLTGLFNHRYFQNSLQQELERAKRFKKKFCLILFDVDHFKKYNDINGHPMGDRLLKGVAQLMMEAIRKIDVAARYGGEEFVIITAETDHKGTMILADRLRETIANHPFHNREKQPDKIVSVSMGVAEYPTHGETKELLIEAADKALYRAKKEGRNRVFLAS